MICHRGAQRTGGKGGWRAKNGENYFTFGDFVVLERCAPRRQKRSKIAQVDSVGDRDTRRRGRGACEA